MKNCEEAKYYTVICDEAKDISNVQQVSTMYMQMTSACLYSIIIIIHAYVHVLLALAVSRGKNTQSQKCFLC